MTAYPIALPSSPAPTKTKITLRNAVGVSESPFTYSQQAQLHQGQRFELEVMLPTMPRAQAAAWVAAMASLNGRYGTFLAGDSDALTPQGTILAHVSTLLVNGSGQTGGTLAVKGAPASTSGLLLAGDYIQLGSSAGSRLYMLTANAPASDGSGAMTLAIWPNLRSSPNDGDTVALQDCVTQWRLAADFGWSTDEISSYAVSFTAVEAL